MSTHNPSTPSRTILVVSEDAGVRADLQFLLVSAGYTCLGAATRDEALSTVARSLAVVDLVVVDADLPLDGARHLTDVLRAAWPDMRLLVLSAKWAAPLLVRAVRDALATGRSGTP